MPKQEITTSVKDEKSAGHENGEQQNNAHNNDTSENDIHKKEMPKKDASKKVADKKAGQKKVDQKKAGQKKPPGFGLILFLLIIIVAAGGAASYYFWTQHLQQARTLKQQQQSLLSLKQQLAQTGSDVEDAVNLSEEHTLQLQQLNQQIIQTETISQQAIKIVNRSQRGWALAEIDYLLRIAHQRIAVARDIAGAIAALKGADERIQQLGDLNLFEVRKQLAKDIGRLNAIHQADVSGISLALDEIIAYLPDLPFKTAENEIKSQLTGNDIVEDSSAEEKTFVDSVLETVKQIGDIKIHQRSIKAASNAEQQKQIEQLLRTYLLGARLAALRFDQTQFLHEINQAAETIKLHYAENDNRIQQLQKTLLEYSALQLSPDLPELTKAWLLLQQKIESKTQPESNMVELESKK